ncbi:MAG: hypothetical protein VYB54_07650 [Pseudomonadota bacterium]|nr:hypothetical protein [Pseudomonadota bacterium]
MERLYLGNDGVPTRRLSVTQTVETVQAGAPGEQPRGISTSFSLGIDPDTGRVVEVFFSDRGRAGSLLHQHLEDLGIDISKAIQAHYARVDGGGE